MAESGGSSHSSATASARNAWPYSGTGGQVSEPLVAQPISKLGARVRAASRCGKLGILHLLVGTQTGLLAVGTTQPIGQENGGAREERRHTEAEAEEPDLANDAFFSGRSTATRPATATTTATAALKTSVE